MCFLGAPRLVIKEEQTDATTSNLRKGGLALFNSARTAAKTFSPSALAFA